MPADKRIRVLVVDDSMMFRTAIAKGLEEDSSIEVVDTAHSAYDARDKIASLDPDVLTLDVEMPGMDGIEFLKMLMALRPMPVIMVSAVDGKVFDAMRAGAVDFVEKPTAKSMTVFSADLAEKIKAAAMAQLPTRIAARAPTALGRTTLPKRETPPVKEPPVKEQPAKEPERFKDSAGIPPIVRPNPPLSGTAAALAAKLDKQEAAPRPASKPVLSGHSAPMLIAIGASTGGTEATNSILKALPPDLPGIVITQHMPPVFTRMYAERLDRESKLTVVEAKDGDIICPGCAYVAPGDRQMRIVRRGMDYVIKLGELDKVSGHCPSVDVLFDSVADAAKEKALGIILTGMGSDGAKGMLKMRGNNAYTIGQDQESCVVYGMPMEAKKINAVVHEAALENIPGLIINRVRKSAN